MSKRQILISLATMFLLSTAAMAEGPKPGRVVNAVIQPEPPSLPTLTMRPRIAVARMLALTKLPDT